MTTFVDFVPSTVAPFTFLATLDGAQYQVVVTWNVAGERYFVTVYDLLSTLILSCPLIESPTGFDFPLTAGYFDDVLLYRSDTAQFEFGGVLNQLAISFVTRSAV